MLTNILKILDTIKKDILELIFFRIDQKIWKKFWRLDLCSLWDPLHPLTCWLSLSVLREGFLGI